MKARRRATVSLSLLALALLAATPPPSDPFAVEEVSPGTFALVRTDPPGLMFEANAGFVVRDEDVVVVDGGSNPASAQRVLAAVRARSTKPVRYVVNTHWHDDHMLGNQVWRDSFPGVRFVAHRTAREDFATDGATNRKAFREGAPGYVAFLKERLAKDSSMAGGPLGAEERASHETSIRLAGDALAQANAVTPVSPTDVFDQRHVLPGRGPRIELRWFGRAHTRGDIVVHLPAEGVVFAGDLVSLPVPLVGSTSFPLDYPATLDSLLALRATRLVPGHGAVQRDDAYVRLVRTLLDTMRAQTVAAVGRGESLPQVRRSVNLVPFRDRLAGESMMRRLLFSNYVSQPGVARAYDQATQQVR